MSGLSWFQVHFDPAGASPRERMLNAARRLFASKGYEHATTSAIARLAGTSESQLMKHFGSKRGLLDEIFVAYWERVTSEAGQAIANIEAPPEKLRAIAETVMRELDREPDLKQLVLLEGRRMRKESQSPTVTEGFLGLVRLADGVFDEMQRTGLLRPGVHPHAARAALMGLLEGLLRDQLLARTFGYPAAYDLSDVLRLFELFVSSFTAQDKEGAGVAPGGAPSIATGC